MQGEATTRSLSRARSSGPCGQSVTTSCGFKAWMCTSASCSGSSVVRTVTRLVRLRRSTIATCACSMLLAFISSGEHSSPVPISVCVCSSPGGLN